MISQIDVQAPELLLRCFYFPQTYGPKEKLDKDIKDIKDFVSEKGDLILEEIERLTNYGWSKSRIPVYLIPDSMFVKYSYSRFDLEPDLPGVILKIGRGDRDKHILIHELVHTNQKHSESYFDYLRLENGERNSDLLEFWADCVTLNILRKHFPEWEEDLWSFLGIKGKNERKGKILKNFSLGWDLEKQSIKFYLERDKEKIIKVETWNKMVS